MLQDIIGYFCVSGEATSALLLADRRQCPLQGVSRCLLAAAEYTGTVASTGIESLILRFGAFELDLKNNELRRAGMLIKLSPQQLRILRYLAENAGRICTREEIQQEIWGTEV